MKDNGVKFVKREKGNGINLQKIFGRVDIEKGIEKRMKKKYNKWKNGKEERMVWKIKEEKVK